MAGTLKYIGQERFDSKVTVTDGGAEITGSIDVDGIISYNLNSINYDFTWIYYNKDSRRRIKNLIRIIIIPRRCF